MSVRRIGTPESSPEGVALELYAGRKVALRAWYRENGQVRLIRGEHYDLAEIAHFLGLRLPEKPAPKRVRGLMERGRPA